MKILHVITGLGLGGAETALCRLIESMPSSEYSHAVVCLGKEDALSPRIRRTGTTLHHLEIHSNLSALRASRTLRRLCRAESADLIHGWMYHANIAAALATLRTCRPLLWGIRCSSDGIAHEKRLTRLLAKVGGRLSALPQAIIYNSEAGARSHESIGYLRSKTRVIPNGFDSASFRPDFAARRRIREELDIAPNAFVVGLIGRWHPVKDHECFLRAAAILSQSRETSVFILAGTGVDSNNGDLMRLARDLNLESRLRLCGNRSDVAAVMASLDVGCSSSAWGEAFPNVIGEMMACGIPCVATELGDVREIIGETGFVVPPREPAAISARLRQLQLLDEQARRSLGDAARRRIVTNYSLAACAAAYGNLYKDTIRRRDVRHNRSMGRNGETTPRGL